MNFMWQNEINNHEIYLLDVYAINYYGILVFFQVCKTTEDTVFLVELGTKKHKGGVTLTKGFKPSKNPLVIVKNNTWRKSTYEVKPDRKGLPIPITFDLPLFELAMNETDFPLTGIFYALPIYDYANKVFYVSEKLDKIINEA